jgi:DNA-binding NarL/FixJ family response regulator
MNIRIAITDDHPMVIMGLQNMLSNYPHIELVATYADGTELMKGLEKELPDVLLLDVQLPGQPGDELAPVIMKKYPELRILALTNLDSALCAHNMLRHGVKGYLLKTTNQNTLIEAIETLFKGEEYIEPSMREKVAQLNQGRTRETALKFTLTPREKEVLQLIVNGDTNKDIAQKLHIGFRTAEYYRFNILLKLDVNNTAALVKKALRLGLAE